MIRISQGTTWAEAPGSPPEAGIAPPVAGRLAFATLWATGNDPASDRLFRVAALRRAEDDSWQRLEQACDLGLEAGGEPAATASARMAREFGVTSAELEGAPPAGVAIRELGAFLTRHWVVVPSRASFLAWLAREPGPAVPPRVLGLDEIAALCWPGRLSAHGEALASELLGHAPRTAERAVEPEHLRAALGILLARVLARPPAELALLAHGLRDAIVALEREERPGGPELAFLLALLDRPSRWRDPQRALEPEAVDLRDGRVEAALSTFPGAPGALGELRPPWTWRATVAGGDPPALRSEEPAPLDDLDRKHVDEIFQEWLPRHFEAAGIPGGYRSGQHAVAASIAASFGTRELRLLHAPTGTGKTLAYLVPCALWARRHHVRVGIATFTRVLQEQAMERDAPLALELLRKGAEATGIRVSVLKGRQNYLCWRALTLQRRGRTDPPEEALAWLLLVLFALHDPDGDLDRFSPRIPLGVLTREHWRRASERVLRSVRCETGCCSYQRDRATCGAEVALRRAENAHVVLTNHALALARRDFFQYLVFDECEHLHDVALNAFSTSVGLRQLDRHLARLHDLDGQRPLDRVLLVAPPGSSAEVHASSACQAIERARRTIVDLQDECRALESWRGEEARERQVADQHSLFREYVQERGEALLTGHGELAEALGEVAVDLAQLQESLAEALPSREAPRLRRNLEILRLEHEELRAAVEGWIPRSQKGRPLFGAESFHDLETGPDGDDRLVVRVLLPHEYLGRHYYPTLAGAVLLSATTWLQDGFRAAESYLGLARAAGPAEGEEREPCRVQSFRAPEAFDYSRVLVAVPREAPSVRDKAAFLDYTVRFLAFLNERTRGRTLALFTNAEDLAHVGQRLAPFLARRRIPFWWQGMRGRPKEELGELFRSQVDSVLLGLDTFWFGADFPGNTLEYLVVVRLPYGVPDRYHHAQCAALGTREQRNTIYLPRALSKFRQGFGRLMRKESDRGCVFVLDKRAAEPRHRLFLGELPLRRLVEDGEGAARKARLVLGDSDRCLAEAFAHMEMKADLRRRGLDQPFLGWDPGTAEGS
jgi:ATP-dependent DNA helicase DinG